MDTNVNVPLFMDGYPALDRDTGKIVFPSHATKERAKQHLYECPECHTELIFRSGKKNRPHFAHYPSDTRKCGTVGNTESIHHAAAKYLLKEVLQEQAGIEILSQKCTSKKKSGCVFQQVQGSLITYLDHDTASIEWSGPKNKWRADVVLTNGNIVRYIFEIYYSHRTSTPRPEPWYEFDARKTIAAIEAYRNEQTTIRLENIREDWQCITCVASEMDLLSLDSIKPQWINFNAKQSRPCCKCKAMQYKPVWQTHDRARPLAICLRCFWMNSDKILLDYKRLKE